jgi:hypothetical protein
MLLIVTKMCFARLDAVQVSQIVELTAATFIMPMPVENGQAGGGIEWMMPVPLGKIPAKQVVPQDTSARHANTTTAVRNVFRILPGRHRMGFTPSRNHAQIEIMAAFYAREAFGTR